MAGMEMPIGFDIRSGNPIDVRTVQETLAFAKLIPQTLRYEGLPFYDKETKKNYQFVGGVGDEHLVLFPAAGGAGGSTTRVHKATVSVGGIDIDYEFPIGTDLDTFIDAIITRFQNPTAGFSITSPAAGFRELGVPVTGTIVLRGSFTKGTADVVEMRFLRNGTAFWVEPDPVSPYVRNYNAVGVDEINATTMFSIEVEDAEGHVVQSSTLGFTFVYPAFLGVVATMAPSVAEVRALTKRLSNRGAFSLTFAANGEHPIFAVPSSWGAVADIKESMMGLSIKGSFTMTQRSFTMEDGVVVSYDVYIQNDTILTAGMTYNITF